MKSMFARPRSLVDEKGFPSRGGVRIRRGGVARTASRLSSPMKILSRNPCCSGHFLGYVACAFCRLIRLLITAPLEVLHFSAPPPALFLCYYPPPHHFKRTARRLSAPPDCLSSALSASVADIVGVLYYRIEWTSYVKLFKPYPGNFAERSHGVFDAHSCVCGACCS